MKPSNNISNRIHVHAYLYKRELMLLFINIYVWAKLPLSNLKGSLFALIWNH